MKLPEAVVGIVVAMAGGLSNYLMDDNHTVFGLLVSVVTAGFAGFIVFLFCNEFGYSENVTAIACGVSGLSGEAILKLLKKISFITLKTRKWSQ